MKLCLIWTALLVTSSEIANAFVNPVVGRVSHPAAPSSSVLCAVVRNENCAHESSGERSVTKPNNKKDWKKGVVSNLVATGMVLASLAAPLVPVADAVELSSGAFVIETSKQEGQTLVKTEIDAKQLLTSLFKNRKELTSSLVRISEAVKDELNTQPAWLEIEKKVLQMEGDVAPEIKIKPPADMKQTVKDISQGKLNIIFNGEIINISVDDTFTAQENEIIIRAKGFKGIPTSTSLVEETTTTPTTTMIMAKSNLQQQMEAVGTFWNSPLPFAQPITHKLESDYDIQVTNGNFILASTVAFVGGSYALSYNYYLRQIEEANQQAEQKRNMAAEQKKKADDADKKRKMEEQQKKADQEKLEQQQQQKKAEEEKKEQQKLKQQKQNQEQVQEIISQATKTLVSNKEADKNRMNKNKKDEDLDMIQTLLQNLPIKDRTSWFGKVYTNCFTGKEAVETFCTIFDQVNNQDDAVELAQNLKERNILHSVVNDAGDDFVFRDSPNKLYRLQPFHTPKVLNSYRIWPSTFTQNPNDPMVVLKKLESIFDSMESRATNKDTGMMDYESVTSDPDYPMFENAICEIQSVQMNGMDDETKLAFGIGLYNLMIKYAFVKVGVPTTNVQRLGFFGKVSFTIGGDVYSFNDLENGILRANSKAPYGLSVPFHDDDSRLNYIVKNFDPRIHFALNCGAKSCPPVKPYTVENIEEELKGTTFEFTDNDENVFVDEDKNELKLTMILNWFSSDFASSKDQIPNAILPYLREGSAKKEKLQRMIDNNSSKSINVNFFEYDWSTNASNCKQYDAKKLKPNFTSIRAIVKKARSKN